MFYPYILNDLFYLTPPLLILRSDLLVILDESYP